MLEAQQYFEAALHAANVLGADAARHFDKLHKLAQTHSAQDLKQVVDHLAGGPTPAPAPPAPRWTPCSHWTGKGDRQCETCQKHAAAVAEAVSHAETVADAAQIEADHTRKVAGTMRRAQDMYISFRPFVLKRLHAELRIHTGGRVYNLFDDVESKVWQNVAARIETYRDQKLKRGAMSWLRAVVYSTVADHFKGEYRNKRDVRKEVPLDDPNVVTDRGAPFVTFHAQPTRPEGAGPDPDEASLAATAQRVSTR